MKLALSKLCAGASTKWAHKFIEVREDKKGQASVRLFYFFFFTSFSPPAGKANGNFNRETENVREQHNLKTNQDDQTKWVSYFVLAPGRMDSSQSGQEAGDRRGVGTRMRPATCSSESFCLVGPVCVFVW